MIKLPSPDPAHEEKSLGETLPLRRSLRSFAPDPLTLDEVSLLLWSGQGIRSGRFRTVPSAGATFPLELILVSGAVEGLDPGGYQYRPEDHTLDPVFPGDRRRGLAEAALGQTFMAGAPVTVAVGAVYQRTTGRYGRRGIRYVVMEVGHAVQNMTLMGWSLGIGSVIIGAFNDAEVGRVLGLSGGVEPLALIPFGRSAD